MNRMFRIFIFTVILSISMQGFCSWDGAEKALKRNVRDIKGLISELVSGGYYYSALPLMKEYLAGARDLSAPMEKALNLLIQHVGIKQFESLPYSYLNKSNSSSARYVLAKKYFRDQKYAKTLRMLQGISPSHPYYAYALHMKGVVLSIAGQEAEAVNTFRNCERVSEEWLEKYSNSRKLQLNKDYCTLGVARTRFQERKFTESDLLFLDIPKSSMVWPEVLFEEAWNSYYKKDYNRTLGKLVTYNAPVFDHVFNPEIEVLKALSYLKLCLYQDAKNTSNDFYSKYMKDTRSLRSYLRRYRRNLSHYYELISVYEKKGYAPSRLMKVLLRSIAHDDVYNELWNQFKLISAENDRINSQGYSRLKRLVKGTISEALSSQKKLMGGYIRGKMLAAYVKLYKAFEGMSYIKLEVLAQKKAKLYSFKEESKKRGGVQYIKRNEKQYFWTFNGEFWADELGDYVFALKSEC